MTERKRKEAELLHKTALLDELFEGSPTRWFSWIWRRACCESAASSLRSSVCGRGGGRTPGCRSDRARGRARRLARRVCASRVRRAVRCRARAPAQGWHAHPCVDQACADRSRGKLIGYYGIYRDITKRKRAEEAQRAQQREREEMQRQLQQAAKMEAIGRLAGGIAHDFNNILGAILGYGELAQKNLEGRAVRRHVDQVMQAGARGKGLVERILAFSRSGLGERVPVHVQSVVEETLEILAASLLPQVRLEKRLDVGDTAVVGDATQLHQVAMNLFTNALQAMEHGGVLTVLLDRESVPERRVLSHGTLLPGPYVRLSVSDTAAASRRRCSSACSIRSSPPRAWATARGWGCRSCTASSRTSAAPSMSGRRRAPAPPSRCGCRLGRDAKAAGRARGGAAAGQRRDGDDRRRPALAGGAGGGDARRAGLRAGGVRLERGGAGGVSRRSRSASIWYSPTRRCRT